MAREKRSTDAVQRAVGRRVAELRRARELTQARVAEALKMEPPNYARIEQGRQNVTIDTLVRLANFFDVAVSELFAPPMSLNPTRPGRPRRGVK